MRFGAFVVGDVRLAGIGRTVRRGGLADAMADPGERVFGKSDFSTDLAEASSARPIGRQSRTFAMRIIGALPPQSRDVSSRRRAPGRRRADAHGPSLPPMYRAAG
jgi:hypothetical protein